MESGDELAIDGDEAPLEDGRPAPEMDENLAALADAEAEVEAIDARIAAGDRSLPYETVATRMEAARRKRGNSLWGAVSLVVALATWVWLAVSGMWREFAHLKDNVPDHAALIEGGLILLAVLLGTIGCRRVAGRRMATAGRVIAWASPPVGWLFAAAYSTYRGIAEGEMVIAIAGTIVIMALGLFAFATLDALLVP